MTRGSWIGGGTAPTPPPGFIDTLAGPTGSSLVGFIQSGSGAVATSVQADMRRRVNVAQFGVSPAATGAANLAALNNAVAYCEANGFFLEGVPGTYAVSGTVNINCDGDLSLMALTASALLVNPVVRVGKIAGAATARFNLTLPRVVNTAHVAGDAWAGYTSSVGVSLDNCLDCVLRVPYVTGFGYGIWAGGVDHGFSYNNVTTGYIADNKVNLRVGSKGALGYGNENTWICGRFRHNGAEKVGGLPVPGTRDVMVSDGNSNVFIRPCVEGDATDVVIDLIDAGFNQFIQPRMESASTVNIRLESTVTNVCSGNFFTGGYSFGDIAFQVVGVCSSNSWLGNGRAIQAIETGSSGLSMRNSNGNGVGQPHISGFRADQQALQKVQSSTDWIYRTHGNGISVKNDASAFPRIDLQAGGLLAIDSGVASPAKGLSGTSSGIRINTDWYPTATASFAMGSASLRWLDTYSANFRPGAGTAIWTSGTGTPEGAVTAPIGSIFTRTDGGASTTVYIKESGGGNTGWVAK